MTLSLYENWRSARLHLFISSMVPSPSQNPLFDGGSQWARAALSKPRLKQVVFALQRGTECSLQRIWLFSWWQSLAEQFTQCDIQKATLIEMSELKILILSQ